MTIKKTATDEAAIPVCFTHRPAWVANHGRLMTTLARELPWLQPTVKMYNRTIPVPRMTAWIGDATYRYSGIENPPAPWHPALAEIRERLALDVVPGRRVDFNSCLANLYRDGSDSVSWHADDEPELGDYPVIASISLGARRTFAIRTREIPPKTWKIALGNGDLLVMCGNSQRDYQHAVPKTAQQVGPRINLTFRSIH